MNNIQSLRKSAGYNQSQLADILSVSQQAVASWESGRTNPRSDLLPKIASVLNCTVDEILRGNL
jgi:transcriptional regulator with XRE-family HTH domain